MRKRWALALLVMLLFVLALPVEAADEKIIYGYSGEGRELEAYRYGNGNNVLVMCFAIHGFEDNFDRDGQALVYTAQELTLSRGDAGDDALPASWPAEDICRQSL